MRRTILLVLSAGALTLPGCRTGTGSGSGSTQGSFSATWVGSDTGELRGTPRASFCTSGNVLEILVTKRDLGVGLAVYPEKELVGGNYEVFDPQDSVVRPGVAAAARWFTEREIRAFQSDWGSLNLVKKGQTLSGGFGMHLRRLASDSDTLVLSGQFKGVIPGPCADSSVSSPDTGE